MAWVSNWNSFCVPLSFGLCWYWLEGRLREGGPWQVGESPRGQMTGLGGSESHDYLILWG